MTREGPSAKHPTKRFFVDAGLVVAALALTLLVELSAVLIASRGEIVASWEAVAAFAYAAPISIAMVVPVAFIIVGATRLAPTRGGERILCFAAGAMAIALVFALDSRALDSAPRRWALAIVAAAIGVFVTRTAVRRVPMMTAGTHALVGLLLGVVLAVVNATVLVRLYSIFHVALCLLTILCFSSLARRFATSKRVGALGAAGLAIGALCIFWTPHAARTLATYDNLRLLLLSSAPDLAESIRFAARIAPPPPLDDEIPPTTTTNLEVTRALDWTNRDIVLLSVDALRADHIGAYGYARPTTPNIDALAREGTVFTHAYCPTPHTSYSVTSMMTGKYMRPLLRMDLGDDSETFAGILRRYGYKTAAFYPPAVFFIDEQRFTDFRNRGLDFEYRKVEFADPALRETQIDSYIDRARVPGKDDAPLFLWVHIFEPHEPYVFHPEHAFGPPGRPTDIDRYDSEIATADALIGSVIARARKERRDPIIIITADHGEEFGDHGGHHHGTTVFEEQVRVPLIIAGRGIGAARTDAPAQTIDILPTVLSALGIPRPARVRGRDLGPRISGAAKPNDPGFAFAETDDFALIATGNERLVCERKVSLCTLYDVAIDPNEKHDLSSERPADVDAAKKLLRTTELDHGRFEGGSRRALPDALRRGLQGDSDAAVDVATLLDDASPEIRKLAAQVCFELHAKETAPSLKRALAKADDADVQNYAALALVRIGEAPSPLAESLLSGKDVAWRRRAALAYAERGDARGARDLTDAFAASRADFEETKTILRALANIHAKEAVPSLVLALADVRLRPYVADALGAIGRPEAKAPLAVAFANERYPAARSAEARALVALAGGADLYVPLRRFAGVPEPMLDAILIAGTAHLLTFDHGALWAAHPSLDLVGDVVVSSEKNQRILIAVEGDTAMPTATVDGVLITLVANDPHVFVGDVVRANDGGAHIQSTIHVEAHVASGAIGGAWVVPLTEDVAAPPPEAWDAGTESTP